MACFVVPAAEAVIATVAVQIAKKHEISQEKLECKLPEGAVQAPEYKISVSRKLSWLRNLLWGGVLLLAFEHLWHGELTPYFPFLQAHQTPRIQLQCFMKWQPSVLQCLFWLLPFGELCFWSLRLKKQKFPKKRN